MSIPSNRKQTGRSGFKLHYLILAVSISLLTFLAGLFIGRALNPGDKVKDLEEQIKGSMPQDKFTFFYTLPNQQNEPMPHTSEPIKPSEPPKPNQQPKSAHQDSEPGKQPESSQQTEPVVSLPSLSGNLDSDTPVDEDLKIKKNSPNSPTTSSSQELSPAKPSDLASPPSPSPQPSPTTPQTRYTLQLGAFRSSAEAEKLIQRLKAKGYSASFSKVDLGPKGIWYRVQSGQFNSREQAEKQRQTLQSQTTINGFITKLNP